MGDCATDAPLPPTPDPPDPVPSTSGIFNLVHSVFTLAFVLLADASRCGSALPRNAAAAAVVAQIAAAFKARPMATPGYWSLAVAAWATDLLARVGVISFHVRLLDTLPNANPYLASLAALAAVLLQSAAMLYLVVADATYSTPDAAPAVLAATPDSLAYSLYSLADITCIPVYGIVVFELVRARSAIDTTTRTFVQLVAAAGLGAATSAVSTTLFWLGLDPHWRLSSALLLGRLTFAKVLDRIASLVIDPSNDSNFRPLAKARIHRLLGLWNIRGSTSVTSLKPQQSVLKSQSASHTSNGNQAGIKAPTNSAIDSTEAGS
ncbi:hypothetical protein HK105_203855 [Polyrhizophydium stewartii]|uniref:Uncharacterized protein n=1 Tax=Polyrhizophydium stewartii TaxID=2732419 RepID=A0ABR4NA84_9FUNG